MIRHTTFFLILAFTSFVASPHRSSAAQESVPDPKTVSVTLNNAHWTEVPLPFQPISVTTHNGKLWACGWDEGIAESADGGKTWQVLHLHRDGEILFGFAFSSSRIYAFGTRGLVWTSENGGRDWNQSNRIPVSAADGTFCGATGLAAAPGVFDFTLDGTKWKLQRFTHSVKHAGKKAKLRAEKLTSQQLFIPDVACLDPRHAAVLVPRNEGKAAARFYYTADAGKTWEAITFDKSLDPRHVAARNGVYDLFGSEGTGSGEASGMILYSSDGAHWHKWLHVPKATMFYCSAFACRTAGGWADFTTSPPQYWRSPAASDRLQWWWTSVGDLECAVGIKLSCVLGTKTDADAVGRFPGKPPASLVKASDLVSARCSFCLLSRDLPRGASYKNCAGFTAVRYLVTRTGSVTNAALLYAPCKPMAVMTLRDVRHWHYIPAKVDGKPVEQPRLFLLGLLNGR